MHGCIGCKERPEIRRSDGLEAAAGAIGQSLPQSSRPIPSACRAETPLHRLSIACGNGGQSGREIAGGRVGPHPVPWGLQGGVESPTDPEGPQTDHKLSRQEAVKWKRGPWPVQNQRTRSQKSCRVLAGRVQGKIVQPPTPPYRQAASPIEPDISGTGRPIEDEDGKRMRPSACRRSQKTGWPGCCEESWIPRVIG